MAPRKVFERNKRTQSICKDRRTIQEPQIVFDGSNQIQEAETEQVLGELNRTQEHELQQVHNAPNQTHDDIDPDITVENSELKRRCEINARVRRNVKLPHNQGSRAFVASRYAMRNDDQEPNRMDFFKATHYSNEKGWTSSNAQTTYEKMVELQSTPVEEGAEPKTIDNIVDEVLGTRSGYISPCEWFSHKGFFSLYGTPSRLPLEAFSSLINMAISNDFIFGFRVGNPPVVISHIQFVDDLILFCGDNETQIRNVVRILRGFEVMSGLKVNLSKSKMPAINVDDKLIDYWASLFHCKKENFSTLYLGLPLSNSKNSLQFWNHIVGITLIKYVLSNLPVYYKSIFPMPASICSLLSKDIAKIIWGSMDHHAVHWINWKTDCLPKDLGGLGLIDFKSKNEAM
ncbi:hypothetical protein V6N13_083730 [Hibiscus sabdariffa]